MAGPVDRIIYKEGFPKSLEYKKGFCYTEGDSEKIFIFFETFFCGTVYYK